MIPSLSCLPFAPPARLYDKGIFHRRAEPIDALRKRQAQFLRRMRRRWIDTQLAVSSGRVKTFPFSIFLRYRTVVVGGPAGHRHGLRLV